MIGGAFLPGKVYHDETSNDETGCAPDAPSELGAPFVGLFGNGPGRTAHRLTTYVSAVRCCGNNDVEEACLG